MNIRGKKMKFLKIVDVDNFTWFINVNHIVCLEEGNKDTCIIHTVNNDDAYYIKTENTVLFVYEKIVKLLG